MLAIVLVFVGGVIGSIWRFWLSGLIARQFGDVFPFGTFFVNLLASGVIGLISGLLLRFGTTHLATAIQQFVAVGICGGLSTFSSLSLQTWNLMMDRRWFAALANVVVSTAGCLLCVAAGWNLAMLFKV
ncbi:MAG: fluoride efflux transporter CrcB [Verrucomicrobia bacterium]|nr:fluoride efflux transporter CrcB [Verrucomicrobiota bacterium]